MFDYDCGDEELSPGDIVTISFRGRPAIGVAKNLKDISDAKRLQTVSSILYRSFFSKQDIARFESIGRAIGQSPSTLFHFTLNGIPLKIRKPSWQTQTAPKPKPLSVQKETVEAVKQLLVHLQKKEPYIQFNGSAEAGIAAISLLQQKHSQILIICPRESSVTHLLTLLPSARGIHGHVPSNKRSEAILGWQTGDLQVLIGTRQTALLPAKDLQAVFVFEEASDDYLSLRRNPRFDARPAALLLAKQHNAPYIALSPSPRMESAFMHTTSISEAIARPKVVSLAAEEEFSGTAYISETVKNEAEKALQKGQIVLFSFNKKGVAKRLQCGACAHIPLCGSCGAVPTVRQDDLVCGVCHAEMWIPSDCPQCHKPALKQKGLGNKAIQKAVASLFPDRSIKIIDKQHPKFEHADIFIVTEFFFKHYDKAFLKRNIGLVAELAFDMALNGADFRSAEQAAFKLHRLNMLAFRHKVPCMIQTWLPDVVKKMIKIDEWTKEELAIRKQYELPPFKGTASFKQRGGNAIKHPIITSEVMSLSEDLIEQFAQIPDTINIQTDTISYENSRSTKTS